MGSSGVLDRNGRDGKGVDLERKERRKEEVGSRLGKADYTEKYIL